VSKFNNWNPQNILNRGLKLLSFIEERWDLRFKDEKQKVELLHLDFVNDKRELTPEIKSLNIIDVDDNKLNETNKKQLKFWLNFVEYCKSNSRDSHIGKRAARPQNSYDISISKEGYYIFVQVYRKNIIRIGLYVNGYGTFDKLVASKDKIEELCGFNLDWYSSREASSDKRVLYSMNIKWDDETNYLTCFNWFVKSIDSLVSALNKIEL